MCSDQVLLFSSFIVLMSIILVIFWIQCRWCRFLGMVGFIHKLWVSFHSTVYSFAEISLGHVNLIFNCWFSFYLVLLLDYRIAECFAFLVCTKWSNPCIHREHQSGGASTSSINRQASSSENQYQDGICGLQNIGGHIMKIPVVVFQILLCMRLEVRFIKFCILNDEIIKWFSGHPLFSDSIGGLIYLYLY